VLVDADEVAAEIHEVADDLLRVVGVSGGFDLCLCGRGLEQRERMHAGVARHVSQVMLSVDVVCGV